MKILIAEDDRVSRFLLEKKLKSLNYEIVVVEDGGHALSTLRGINPPSLAILDWMMPGMDGVDVTRAIRNEASSATTPPYIILLTAKTDKQDIVDALEAGADDYLTKPFDARELRARVQVGIRIVELQSALAARVCDLEVAFANVKQLQGMLPICSYCKKIRDDQNYWQGVEDYFSDHSEVQFSHGICPGCYETTIKPDLEKFLRKRPAQQVQS